MLTVHSFEVVLLATVAGDGGAEFHVDESAGEGDDHADNPHEEGQADGAGESEDGARSGEDTGTDDAVEDEEGGRDDADLALGFTLLLKATYEKQVSHMSTES